MAEDANKMFYFDVLPDKDVLSFLERAENEEKNAEVWRKGQEKEHIETFKVISFDQQTRAIKLRFKTEGLLKALKASNNVGKNVLLKIPFDNIYLFTNTHLSYNADEDIYHAIINQDVYKSQQRSNYRLEANKFIRLQFKIDGQVFEANDVSAGGTSFSLEKSQAEKFQKNSIFRDLKVKIAKTTYDIPEARIASLNDFPFRDDFGNELIFVKVGVAFINLPKKLEEELTITVNAEARGEELRKMNTLKS